MNSVVIKKVMSFDDEIESHRADNLVSDTVEKGIGWRGQAGARQHSVELQLEKTTLIHSLEITNAGSAFIEVRVGRQCLSGDSDYEVLLCMASFMTSLDCKDGVNDDRTREFGQNNLSQAIASQKWDRVKIICTQPFTNKPYGITSIKIFSEEEVTCTLNTPTNSHTAFLNGDVVLEQSKPKKLGAFTLRPEKKKERLYGNLFKTQKSWMPGTIRANQESQSPTIEPQGIAKETTREENIAKQTMETKAQHLREHEQRIKEMREREKEGKERERETTKHRMDSSMGEGKGGREERKQEKKMDKEGQTKRISPQTKRTLPVSLQSAPTNKVLKSSHPASKSSQSIGPLNQAMVGVMFVLSGFKNPLRGQIRDKALAMGARYSQDWNSTCTHLIAAFENTPKVKEVKSLGHGWIVTSNWILDSFTKGRKLRESFYGIGRPKPEISSESEEDKDGGNRTKDVIYNSNDKERVRKRKVVDYNELDGEMDPQEESDDSDSDYDGREEEGEEEEEEEGEGEGEEKEEGKGGEEEEEEITDRRTTTYKNGNDVISSLKANGVSKLKREGGEEDREGQQGENELLLDEDSQRGRKGIEESQVSIPLPTFLSGVHVYIYGKMDYDLIQIITRYVTGYAGRMDMYMCDDTTHVVTDQSWDSNFESAVEKNPKLSIVKPSWVISCHNRQKRVAPQRYMILPDCD